MNIITQKLKLPILGLLLTFGMFSCQALEERIRPKKEVELNIPETFDFATIQNVTIDLSSKDDKGNAVSIPYIGIYDKDPSMGGTLLYVTGTDTQGIGTDAYSFPSHIKNVYLETNIPGVSNVETPIVNERISQSFIIPEGTKTGRLSATEADPYYGFDNTLKGYLLYEDNWPYKGDFDLNDLAVKYNYNFKAEGLPQGRTRKLELIFDVVAIGGQFDNGFSIKITKAKNQRALTLDDIANIELTVNGTPISNYKNSSAVSQEDGEGVLFDIFSPTNLAADLQGTDKNKQTNCNSLPTAKLEITFNDDAVDKGLGISNLRLGNHPYDPFIYVNGNKGREVHLVNRTRTQRANNLYPYTIPDNSNDNIGTPVYKVVRNASTEQNMPFAILVPAVKTSGNTPLGFKFLIPQERSAIYQNDVYPSFATWASSGGGSNPNWYYEPKNNTVIPCK
ncbi:LruC domain-containing protein [Rhodocytophaga aerolata]|uniref:LruC domain-containing protein n=1 Tax=Rhodocytophaga aerolata TaxID=455078 RepID=A0ABT8RCI1_9BACT|nr:LruC domain-containing protein [Rhodocytophaga aerolata]MDO1449808.1 LruC domain-containing protein [Rhodocytophaga aerolata]